MICLIPDPSYERREPLWQPLGNENLLLQSYRQNVHRGLLVLENRSPKWNDQIGAYVLNFNGRVSMVLVKNFQLVFPGC